jgi:hypothetical protein
LLTLTSFTVIAHGDYLKKQIFMDLPQAERRYSSQTFSALSFKRGTSTERGKMAVSLIKGKAYVGKTSTEIKETLGDFTGYFFSESVPAYLIDEGWKEGKDTWQIVFLLGDAGRVNDVRINKNCCPKK